jgi:Na+-driven multidrug efflux pump
MIRETDEEELTPPMDDPAQINENTPLLNETTSTGTQKNAATEFLKLAAPMLFSSLIISIYRLGTGKILAGIDDDTLAAEAVIAQIHGVVIDVSASILIAVGLAVKNYQAKGDYKLAGEQLTKAAPIVAGITAIAACVLFPIEPILLLFKQSDAVANITMRYFLGFFGCIPAIMFMVAVRQVLFGIGDVIPPVVANIFFTGLTLPLGYLLSHGFAGETLSGAFGMGLANTIIAWPAFLGLLIYTLKRHKPYFSQTATDERSFWQISRAEIQTFLKGVWDLLKVGSSIAITPFVNYFFSLTLTLLIGTLGQQYLIPQGILAQYMAIVVTLLFAISDSNSILIREALIRKPQQITSYFRLGMLSGSILAFTASTLFLAIPEQLLSFFYRGNPDPVINDVFKTIAAIGAASTIIQFVSITSQGALIGMGDGLATAKINTLSLALLGIPALLISTLLLDANSTAINIIRTLILCVSAILMLARWRNEHREIKNQAPEPEPNCIDVVNSRVVDFLGPSYKKRLEANLPQERSETPLP